MYICGKNVVKEYVDYNSNVKVAYVSKNFNDEEILKKLKNKNINIKMVDKNELDRLTKENHQGVILNVDDYQYSDIDDITKKEDAFIVILDHLEDPHNFGAIVRTCEAAGVDGIIIPKNRTVDVTGTVIRTSVGATKFVPIVQVTNLVNTMKDLKKKGFWFTGTDMDGTDYTKLDYKGKIGLIVGSEGNGMSRIVKENCDFIATIPMKGKINSLNASVATAVVIYEAVRNRAQI